MRDLYAAILIHLLLSAILAALAIRAGHRLHRRRAGLLLMISVLLLLAYQRFVADRLWLARIVPFSNAVILCDLFPPLAAFMAGLAWTLIPGNAFRRGLLLVPLVMLSWWSAAGLIFGSPPRLLNRWSRGVCIQTSNASCSAAAAATLLNYYDIRVTEAEMARVCLTRQQGTSMLGLYRGLMLQTRSDGWKPLPFESSLQDLQKNLPGPVLLDVELPVGDPRTDHFIRQGWDPGLRHTVVLFRFLPDGSAEMGDPSTGRERWPLEDLAVLWRGGGLRLVRR